MEVSGMLCWKSVPTSEKAAGPQERLKSTSTLDAYGRMSAGPGEIGRAQECSFHGSQGLCNTPQACQV